MSLSNPLVLPKVGDCEIALQRFNTVAHLEDDQFKIQTYTTGRREIIFGWEIHDVEQS